MKTFEAISVDSVEIILKDPSDFNDLWELLENNENFIISFINKDKKRESRVMIASDLLPKIKNADIKLSAIIEVD